MTDNSVAVATTKFLFGMCDCTVDSEAGTCDFALVLESLHEYGDAHMRSHVSPGMDCKIRNKITNNKKTKDFEFYRCFEISARVKC